LLRHEGVTFKKSLRASEQDRPDVAFQRDRWKARQAAVDPARLVFIDETWAKTNMTHTHGRCRRGGRLVAEAPFGKWRTSPSWRRCGAIGSLRPASSTDRSTA
jgi:hypothetical protein